MIGEKSINNDDLVFEKDSVKVISDELTLEMINGSKIVYKEEMIRSAFEVVENPMAEGGCSCGTSFTPKN
jgi:iron-sulfur cluster assembly 2